MMCLFVNLVFYIGLLEALVFVIYISHKRVFLVHYGVLSSFDFCFVYSIIFAIGDVILVFNFSSCAGNLSIYSVMSIINISHPCS